MALLKTIFDLPTKKEELSSMNQNMSDIFYREVQPLRNVQDSTTTTPTFGQGIISLRWDLDSQTWWIPSKSYFRFRVQYLDAANNPLVVDDNIAPAMGVAGNLFQKIQFKMANQTICSVDENLAECEAFATRQMKSGQWMRDMGNNINFWEASREKRVQEISQNGVLGSSVIGNQAAVDITNLIGLGGISALSTIAFDETNNVLTLAVAGSFVDLLQAGDVLVIKLAAEVFQRAFIVKELITIATVQLASFGTILPGALAGAAGTFTLERYRFSKCNFMVNDYAAITQASYTGDNIITANAGSWEELNDGDVTLLDDQGDQVFLAHTITLDFLTIPTTAQGSTFNVQDDIAAAANNDLSVLRYQDTTVRDLLLDGYLQSAAAAEGHACSIARSVAGDPILTITAVSALVANLVPVPDVRENFKVGDFVVLQIQGGSFVRAMVSGINPDNNGRSLSVIGSDDLLIAINAGNDARTFLFKRYRYINLSGNANVVNSARQVSDLEILWKPASLPIFNSPHAIPGGCLFEFELDPYQNTFYQRRAIESAPGTQLVSGTDYKFLVTDLRLYIAQCQGPIVEKMEYMIDMNRVKCHKTNLTTNSVTTTSIDVQPSSYALSLAFQDKRSGSRSDLNPSKFKIINDDELNLTRYSIRFAGKSLPDPDFDGSYDSANNLDRLSYMYARNMLYNGAYFDNSQETLNEWRERGIYFYHPFLRSGTNKESRCYVVTQFGNTFSDADNVNILLFENYKSVAIVRMDNGRVYNIKRNDS